MTKIINSHMQAITTKYFGPTNTKGSRIKASCYAGSLFVPYDHSLSAQGNHDNAANKLMAKLEWNYSAISGSATDTGYVYVLFTENML